MPSKKFDLEKSKAKKTLGRLAQSGTPARFGAAAMPAVDRREQRRLDQAAGLLPFATKLPARLIESLHAAALARGQTVGEWLTQELPALLPTVPSAGSPEYHASTPAKEG